MKTRTGKNIDFPEHYAMIKNGKKSSKQFVKTIRKKKFVKKICQKNSPKKNRQKKGASRNPKEPTPSNAKVTKENGPIFICELKNFETHYYLSNMATISLVY